VRIVLPPEFFDDLRSWHLAKSLTGAQFWQYAKNSNWHAPNDIPAGKPDLPNYQPKNRAGISPCKFKGCLDSKNELHIAGKKVKDIIFGAHFRQRKQQLNIPSVVVYDQPSVDALNRNVFIEAVELGNFEITQSTNNVCVSIDLTAINSPPNCLFLPHFDFHFSRTVTIKHIYFCRPTKMGISPEGIGIGVIFGR